jgi:hypothetical protein
VLTRRQVMIVIAMLLPAAGGMSILACRSRHRIVDAAFWFEPVTYGPAEAMTRRLGGPVSADELRTIAAVARAELIDAFAPLRIAFSEDREAMYRVRVVEDLKNRIAPRYPGPAGESRSVPGVGGEGALSFRMLVSNAVAYAPEGTDRGEMIAAIGRGIGRAAVHEFAHQLLGSAPIHESTDTTSFEYESAGRPEQYYGALHWTVAWPLLTARVGLR